MLARAEVIPVVHVANLDRARKFYGTVLGLKEETTRSGGNLVFAAGRGTHLELMQNPDGVQTDATVVTFEVEDVDQEMKDLTTRGAKFEDVDVKGATRAGKISTMGGERAAWFKDTEGNWLCVHDKHGRA